MCCPAAVDHRLPSSWARFPWDSSGLDILLVPSSLSRWVKQHTDARLGLSTRNIFTVSPCPRLEGDKLTQRVGCPRVRYDGKILHRGELDCTWDTGSAFVGRSNTVFREGLPTVAGKAFERHRSLCVEVLPRS